MKQSKNKVYYAKTIDEAINILQTFFECDMWYSCHAEWKKEEDMLRYLRGHFGILRKEIELIRKKDKKKDRERGR